MSAAVRANDSPLLHQDGLRMTAIRGVAILCQYETLSKRFGFKIGSHVSPLADDGTAVLYLGGVAAAHLWLSTKSRILAVAAVGDFECLSNCFDHRHVF